MEFKLEDFDNQQKQIFDLEEKIGKKKSFGEKEREYSKRRKKNPGINLIIKTLIVCFVIDFSIWAYFHFIRKVPVLTGLQEIFQPKVIEQPREQEIRYVEKKVVEYRYLSQRNDRFMYSWTDKNGVKHFSNVGLPKDGNYTEGKAEKY